MIDVRFVCRVESNGTVRDEPLLLPNSLSVAPSAPPSESARRLSVLRVTFWCCDVRYARGPGDAASGD